MDIRMVIPESPGVRGGNLRTARQWADFFRQLGHEPSIAESGSATADCDLLVALHAEKTAGDVAAHSSPCIVVLTGTDIYPAPSPLALESIRRADRLVGLHGKAFDRIPEEFRGKGRVIVQSAEQPEIPRRFDPDFFDVCVIGHLREVKDPLRAAEASRQLPNASRIRIRHAGGIIDPEYREAVQRMEREIPRYHYLGELEGAAVQELIAGSRIMVLSSKFEGGARVLGEALVAGTPVLASRMDAVTAVLGDDYPGLFDCGDTARLTELLERSEADEAFYRDLLDRCAAAAPLFDPAREREAWKELLEEVPRIDQ